MIAAIRRAFRDSWYYTYRIFHTEYVLWRMRRRKNRYTVSDPPQQGRRQ